MKNLLTKIYETLSILLHSKGGKYIFQKSSSIASFHINEALSKIENKINTIIDIGANIGQYASASKQFYPESIIHSFEPVPSCFKQLKNNTLNQKDIYTHNLALGSSEGTIKFYQNEHSHASSALPVSGYQKENVPITRNAKEIEVKVSTLDTFTFSTLMPSPILLKMDVQGYEMEVLKGGREFLKKVDYVLLETSFTPMYENEPLFDDLHTYLKSEGFELLAPLDFLRKNDKILQMDVLYKKKR